MPSATTRMASTATTMTTRRSASLRQAAITSPTVGTSIGRWWLSRWISVSSRSSRSSINSTAVIPRAAPVRSVSGGQHRRQPRQQIEGEAADPPVLGHGELERVEGGVRPDHGAEPCRHLVTPMPNRVEQTSRQNRNDQQGGCRNHRRRSPCRLHERDGLAPEHRQDDHDVQADEQARRGRVVDRRHAALRRLGPEPDPEHEIEAAPVQQAEQDLVRDLAGDGMRITDPARHDARRDPQRQQREGVEQCAMEEGAHRQFAGMAREDAVPCPLQQHARQPFRGEAGDDDAEQERRHAQAELLRQAREVVAQRRQAGEDLLHPFGERAQEHARHPLAPTNALHDLGPGNAGRRKDGGQASQYRRMFTHHRQHSLRPSERR